MSEPTLIGVSLDQENMDRLDQVIGELQFNDPDLSVDDCIDVIFSIGLISTYSTITVMQALKTSAESHNTLQN